ncbi:MAG: PilT/PilU family type 4a pilus ATPase [Coriobacteriia bacterium]|nr:PilT/PilU family type 4a pilus ATPase [Coriobacteriia bacterium]
MSKQVLIVHDDEAFVAQLSAALVAAAADTLVDTALSAPRALGMVAQQMPDVFVVEAELIGVDGYAFTQQLKADPQTKDVPVVIVTAMPNEASALRARQAGASAHLSAAGAIEGIAGKVLTLAGSAPAPAAAAPAPVSDMPAPMPMPVVPSAPAPMPAGPPPMPVSPMSVDAIREPMGAPEQMAAPSSAVPSVEPAAGVVAAPEQTTPGPIGGLGGASPARSVEAATEGSAASYGTPQPVTPPKAPDSGGMGSGVPQPVSGSVSAASDIKMPGSDIPHIDDLLRLMLERGGSDLHITVGSPPGIRQRGELVAVEEMKPLTPRDTMEMILSLLSEEQRRRFETELELDFAYSIPGVSRFRANVFQQRNSMGAVFRVIPIKIPTMDELALPKVCRFLADRPRGLVLVTGPTGSGKSTTLAAMINHINETKSLHIITMEDPIEFMHRNKKSFVNQREVGEDTHSFASALKRVLRQDPDVILVGEMRDLETISAAITAAETGHLVLATLHTTGGPETVDRIIDVFPPHQQQQVRMQLSNTLEGVLSQVLLRSTDGRNRMLAMEIMLGVPAISNLIREGKTHQMDTIIQGGAQLGMQTLDQHLKILLTQGKISFEEAISKAKSPRELADMVGRKI